MRLAYRLAVVGISLAAILLASYDLASPYRVGMVGVDEVYLPTELDVRITNVYPNSPAARAGLRTGDIGGEGREPLWSRLAFYARRADQRVTLLIQHDGEWHHVTLTAAPYLRLRPIEQGPLAYAILLAFAIMATLIALRGQGANEVGILAFLLAFCALERSADWYISTAPSTSLALAATFLDVVAWALVLYCELLFVALFPPVPSPLRRAIRRIAAPLMLAATLFIVGYALVPTATLFAGILNGILDWGTPMELVQVVVYLLLVAGAVDAIAHADTAHRVQTRWAASAIIVSTLPLLARSAYLAGGQINPTPFITWVTLLSDVPLLAIMYAVLRHRLVDLGVLISRAAIFTTVSVSIVALFIIAEWIGGNILASALGESARRGPAGEAYLAGVALVLGFSVRSIHSFTERYLNRIFFAGREASLARLRQFAQETDVITNIGDLFRLTYETLDANTEGTYTAVYVLDGDRYRARCKPDALAATFGMNDAAMVRLRRWNEPYEVERGSHHLSEALLLPMTVRGLLLGFLCCGPKRERTKYSREEIDVLATVARRVGAAYEFISREGALTPVRTMTVQVEG